MPKEKRKTNGNDRHELAQAPYLHRYMLRMTTRPRARAATTAARVHTRAPGPLLAKAREQAPWPLLAQAPEQPFSTHLSAHSLMQSTRAAQCQVALQSLSLAPARPTWCAQRLLSRQRLAQAPAPPTQVVRRQKTRLLLAHAPVQPPQAATAAALAKPTVAET